MSENSSYYNIFVGQVKIVNDKPRNRKPLYK